MPFRNSQPPDLNGFTPGHDFDHQQDRLVLLTAGGENLVVFYGTSHGVRYYAVDGKYAPRGNWPAELGLVDADAWERTEVTINPQSGIIEISLNDVVCLESVFRLESIFQTRDPLYSRIQLGTPRRGRSHV